MSVSVIRNRVIRQPNRNKNIGLYESHLIMLFLIQPYYSFILKYYDYSYTTPNAINTCNTTKEA